MEITDRNAFISDIAGIQRYKAGETNIAQIERFKKAASLAINDLTEKQKQIVEMRYVRVMLLSDIAEELEISKSSVSRTLKRAITNLQKATKYVT